MGQQLLKARQVTGITQENLQEELEVLLAGAKHLEAPVATRSLLPVRGDINGQMRVVLDEATIYVWDELVAGWRRKQIATAERRMTLLTSSDEHLGVLLTPIGIGIDGGVVDLKSVGIMINGQWQHPTVDYIPEENPADIGKMQIRWVSKDFALETDDTIYVIYDILKFR